MAWYAPTLPAPDEEPVTLAMAKAHVRVLHDDEDAHLTQLTKSARGYCEGYTGLALGSRSIALKCDGFADLARLPVSPVSAATAIAYIDAEGDAATVDAADYELRPDGMDAAIVWIGDGTWPAIETDSRVTVTVTVGATVPDDVLLAMLLHVGDSFNQRENAKAEDWTAVDCLLANHRFYP